MLTHASPVAFLATTQPEPAKDFYTAVLGLTLLAETEFALLFETHGLTLRLQKVRELQPQPFTAFGWRVDNAAEVVTRLAAQGVVFERYPHMAQDEMGIWSPAPGVSVAWFKDPDGNLLSLSQEPG